MGGVMIAGRAWNFDVNPHDDDDGDDVTMFLTLLSCYFFSLTILDLISYLLIPFNCAEDLVYLL